MIKKKLIVAIGIIFCIGLCIPGAYWYYTYKTNLEEIIEKSEQYEENNSVQNQSLKNSQVTKNKNENNNDNGNNTESSNIIEFYQMAKNMGSQVLSLELQNIDNIWIIGYDSEHWEDALNDNLKVSSEMQELFLDSPAVTATWYLLDPNSDIKETWAFYTGLNYTDTQIPVCWIDTDQNNNVLAAVVADYDMESDIFWNTTVYATYFGSQYAFAEPGEDSEENNEASISSTQFVSGVKSIADALEEYTEPLVVEPDEIPYKYDYDEEETGR